MSCEKLGGSGNRGVNKGSRNLYDNQETDLKVLLSLSLVQGLSLPKLFEVYILRLFEFFFMENFGLPYFLVMERLRLGNLVLMKGHCLRKLFFVNSFGLVHLRLRRVDASVVLEALRCSHRGGSSKWSGGQSFS